jgi:hypothetical protein
MSYKRMIDAQKQAIADYSRNLNQDNLSDDDRNKLGKMGDELKALQNTYDAQCGLPPSATQPQGDIFDSPPVRDTAPTLS